MLTEKAHCQAFLKVDQARGDTSLTYFEFGTLAALLLMADSNADYLLLEVGLGGRLDAINIVDATIAVITSIDLDHQDWLGDTKELIAIEKAGVFRANIPAVIGEPHPPITLVEAASSYQVKPVWQGIDFQFQLDTKGFHWQGVNSRYDNLPIPNIPAQNASTALQVIEILGLNLDNFQMTQLINQTRLPGRRQVIQNTPCVMLDVAHNPQATSLLALDIKNMQYKRVIAVVGMLADKDIEATLAPMLPVVSVWYCATLDAVRGAHSSRLVSAVLSSKQKVLECETVEVAYQCALENAEEDDLVIVFGSFFTVTNVLKVATLTPQEKV
jgi:dihydrofolate synthase/folylpolyglutamate synthase